MTAWLWALTVVITAGLAAPVVFAYAAVKGRKRSWYAVAAIYAVLCYGGIVLASSSADDSPERSWAGAMFLTAWIAGTVHVFTARRELERRRVLSPTQRAVERARAQVAQRKEAQRLAAKEPEVALQLGVGRPDLRKARAMGVVDVNRAPAKSLAELPGVDPALAREIVRAREEIDGFASLEDLGVVLHLDGDVVEDLRPYVVFIPR